MNTNEFLADLFSRRELEHKNVESARLLELYGAEIIEPTAFEPDPNTHRSDFYYNAVNNVLYKKVSTTNGAITISHWKPVSA